MCYSYPIKNASRSAKSCLLTNYAFMNCIFLIFVLRVSLNYNNVCENKLIYISHWMIKCQGNILCKNPVLYDQFLCYNILILYHHYCVIFSHILYLSCHAILYSYRWGEIDLAWAHQLGEIIKELGTAKNLKKRTTEHLYLCLLLFGAFPQASEAFILHKVYLLFFVDN